MTRVSTFVRNAPKLFYIIAVLDFLKYMLPLVQLYLTGRADGLEYDTAVHIQLFSLLLSATVFAAGWVAYGMIATLLIALYDEVVALGATDEDGSDA